MALICSETDLKRYIQNAVEVDPERPVLVDKYMDRADELDVDALCDKDGNVTICGIMQHIEQAGVHSGMHPPSSAAPVVLSALPVLHVHHCKSENYRRACHDYL
jgi:carbamoylphosphate synthase large subunit